MAIKKSELYSSLWAGADALRGGMDASQYKDYVLTLLFVKYVSDKFAGQPSAQIVVPPGGSFTDMVALKGKPNIGEGIQKILGKLAEENKLKGVIDRADFDDDEKLGKGKDKQDRLSDLIGIFQEPALNFSKNRADGDDLLGDAYEYLMRNFATQSGKSKGQFYTPAEVSRVIAQVIGISHSTSPAQTLYDPTCGSGSLLLKAADLAPYGITIFGQEMDLATSTLAKMNMILHNHAAAALNIWQDNTLSSPYFTEKGSLRQFDFVVSNPPFSFKKWRTGFDPQHDLFHRFEFGVPPRKSGDYAFFLHLLRSMKSTGKGAIILPHGALYRGNTEATIRKEIINRGYIKGIIGLPTNLFYGTTIAACIIVLDKEFAAGRKGIFMVDASKGYIKDGNKNRLRFQDLHRIVDVFNNQIEVEKYSRMVPHALIAEPKNDYNLNLTRYIDSSEPEDLQDIDAHLRGDIPEADITALRRFWQVNPTLQTKLFTAGSRPGYCRAQIEPSDVKNTIHSHGEFVNFANQVAQLFGSWRDKHTPALQSLSDKVKPKQLIQTLSEDLLQTFAHIQLLDPYDLYQDLMTYWADLMQDDVYLIVADGWEAGKLLAQVISDKDKPEFNIGTKKYKGEIIPVPLVLARYFSADVEVLNKLQEAKDTITRQLDELDEEHGGEEGLLADAKTEKGKFTKQSVETQIKSIQFEADSDEERALLNQCLAIVNAEVAVAKQIKDTQLALNYKVVEKYTNLTIDEIKQLVIDDKWLTFLTNAVTSQIERQAQVLAARIQELSERYQTPLPQLTATTDAFTAQVDANLKKMGYVWN